MLKIRNLFTEHPSIVWFLRPLGLLLTYTTKKGRRIMSQLNTVRCPFCNSNSFGRVYPDNPSAIVRCLSCDLVFFNPQPSLEYLRDFYSSQSGYMSSIQENLDSFKRDPSAWKNTANFILDKVYQYIKEQSDQRILDVGSAYGFFLLFAKERGLDAHGIEISSETSRYAKEHGIDVQHTTLVEANLEEASFNIITMNNVLEHTLNPVAELTKAYNLLKTPGVVFIAVPNFDSLTAQVDAFYWKMKSWPNHMFYFTEKTLSAILSKVGFRVVEVFTHLGEADYSHDVRVVRDRMCLTNESDINEAIHFLHKIRKGQELVILARKE